MKLTNIQQAKTHLSRLVDEAAAGADVVIAKAGKPLVRLVPFAPPPTSRQLGALAGQVQEADDCWSPDPAMAALFYEGESFPPPESRVTEEGQ
jgi:prevent-host-death family protein